MAVQGWYRGKVPSYGDLMTVQEWLGCVQSGGFIDYDGYGYPVKDGKFDPDLQLWPSEAPGNVPADATHVIWFNR